MNNSKITLIISTLNAEKNLEKTIVSYLNQSYLNKELIIIDGGSTDKTNQIILKYKDHVFYRTSEKDTGVYDAWNKGISVCTGDWICFLGSGDQFYSENTLSDLIKLSNNDIYELASLQFPMACSTSYSVGSGHVLSFSVTSPITIKYRGNQAEDGVSVDGFNYDFNFYL